MLDYEAQYEYQKEETFEDATTEELKEIYDLITEKVPSWWLLSLNEWADGIQKYRPYDYATGAQYIIGTLKGVLNL